MRLFKSKRIAFWGVLLGLFALSGQAAEKDYQYYENAKIAVNYNGEVGYLLQKISDKLKIGYLSFNVDSSSQIVVNQTNNQTLKELIASVNNQLKDSQVSFDTLGNRVILVLSDGKETILKQYIGPIIFDNGVPESSPSENESLENKQGSSENKIDVQLPENNEKAEVLNQNSDDSGLTAEDLKVKEKQSKIIDSIFKESNDEKILARYKKKKEPTYQATANSAMLGLEDIKSTPISTFLLFSEDTDVNTYSVKGPFEKIGKWGNVIAILHKTWKAPIEIRITDSNNQVLRLNKI